MEIRNTQQKRACNMVWTAAGRYDFEPQYLFLQEDDEPSLYLNTLEGLGYSCFKEAEVLSLLKGIEIGREPDTFRCYVQLILERVIFLRVREKRPSIDELRREYALRHIGELRPPERYQEMSEHRQVLLHCYRITGKNLRTFTKKEVQIADEMDALAVENARTKDDEALVAGIKELLWREFYYHFRKARESEQTAFVGAGLLMVLLGRLFHTEFRLKQKQDENRAQTGAGKGHLKVVWRRLLNRTTAEEDQQFVRQIFGECLFDERMMEKLESAYCTGYHTHCHLWYADTQ